MSTSINTQTSAIIAKDIVVAALSGDSKALQPTGSIEERAAQIAQAYETIFRKVAQLGPNG